MRSLLVVAALLVSLPATADTLRVTNTADSGPGSFRNALERANALECGSAPCRIVFEIPGPVPASGWFTLRPRSMYPIVMTPAVEILGATQTSFTGDTNPYGPEIEIDGSEAGYATGLKFSRTQSGIVQALAINNFQANGLSIDRCQTVRLNGNYVGVDPTGAYARPNGLNGLTMFATTATVESNIFSGNRGNGVLLEAGAVQFTGNRIGVGRVDAFQIPNGANGMDISSQSSQIVGNTVACNRDHGITIGEAYSRAVIMRNNVLFGNGYMSIDLGHDGVDGVDPLDADEGPNGKTNAPQLTSARNVKYQPAAAGGGSMMLITGSVRSRPLTRVALWFYASPHRSELGFPEARLPIGTAEVTTNGEGVATFSLNLFQPLHAPGGWVTATSTIADEGTSELAPPVPLVSGDVIEVTTTADSGPGSLRAALERANASDCTGATRCWIAFRIPESQLVDGVARIEPLSPLPVVIQHSVYIDGETQTWWTGDWAPEGPEVELLGTHAGANAAGLRLGIPESPVADAVVRGLSIGNFSGDGLVVHQFGGGHLNTLSNLRVGTDGRYGVIPNENGIVYRGDSGGQLMPIRIRSAMADILVANNRRHGFVLDARAMHVRGVHARNNGGHGIYVTRSRNAVTDGVAIGNARAGVATSAGVRQVVIKARTFANGGLGIDRNEDGITPNDFGEADGVTDTPELFTATAATGVVTGRYYRTPAVTTPPEPGLYYDWRLDFYVSSSPDPSGRGEGEELLQAATLVHSRQDYTFRATFGPVFAPFLLRGRYISATRTLLYCSFNGGCTEADTSEFGDVLRIE